MARIKKKTYYAVQISGENTRYHFYYRKTINSVRRLIDRSFQIDPTARISITRHSHWFRGKEIYRAMEINFFEVRTKNDKWKIIKRYF